LRPILLCVVQKKNITIFIILIKTLCTPFSPTSNIKEGSPRQHFNEFDKLQLHSTNWEHTSSSRFLKLETYIIRYNQSSAKGKTNWWGTLIFQKIWKYILLCSFAEKYMETFQRERQCMHVTPHAKLIKYYKTGQRGLVIFLSFNKPGTTSHHDKLTLKAGKSFATRGSN